MPDYGNVIVDAVLGGPLILERTWEGLTVGTALRAAELRIKARNTDPDEATLLHVPIVAADAPQGRILDTGATTGVARGTFSLATQAVRATLLLIATDGVDALRITARTAGYAGTNLRIAVLAAGTNAALTLTVTRTAIIGSGVETTTITIGLATDGAGLPISLVADVAYLINADVAAGALVQADIVGSAGSILAPAGEQSLIGGTGGTIDFVAGRAYVYTISLTSIDGIATIVEAGTITFRAPNDYTPTNATISGARASDTNSARYDVILNRYVDATIELFRRLRVWDMKARRSGTDPTLLTFPYRNWNPSFFPEVYDGQDDPVPANRIEVDYAQGLLRVRDDPIDETYYATFEFDYFGIEVLKAWLEVTLQELNVAGAVNRYLTHYLTVDQAPPVWDAPLTYGVLVKAYRRLAADTMLWSTRSIWPNDAAGAGAQQLAADTATQLETMYTELRAGLKWQRFIAKPTYAFAIFQSSGWGGYALGTSRFLGYTYSGRGVSAF
jgi:hypothetical protein